MGARAGTVPLTSRRQAIDEATDIAVRPYRDLLREVRHAVAQADEGLIEPVEALHLIDRAAARGLGEGTPRG